MLESSKLKNMNPAKSMNYYLCAKKVIEKIADTIYPEQYENLTPQNQVLVNGMFFDNLLQKYLGKLNINFKDTNIKTGAEYIENRPMISKKEYENLPKQYRGMFTKHDSANYILHSSGTPYLILSVSKNNKAKLKSLLDQAYKLISKIYNKDIALSYKNQEHHFSEKFVPKDKVATIIKLHEIFNEIESTTRLIQRCNVCFEIQPGEYVYRAGAQNLYNEYQNELTSKNRYLNAQKAINNANGKGIETLLQHTDKKYQAGMKVLLEYTKQNSETVRRKIIADLKDRIM